MKKFKEFTKSKQEMPDMKKILKQREDARKHVEDLANELRKKKEKE